MTILGRTLLHPLMVFALVVAMAGGGLWAAGVMRNLVTEAVNQAQTLIAMSSGTQSAGRPQVAAPQAGSTTGPPQGGRPAGAQNGGTNWRQGLFILTDLWYIAAATLVVILIERVIGIVRAPRMRTA